MRRPAAALAALVLGLTAVAGCGDDEEPTGGQNADGTIEITIADGEVSPNGERVDVEPGEEIELEVTSDVAGELHVHATPEQELAYDEGTTTLTLTIDEPGVVDVEDHELGVVIVQLEVG